MDSNRPKDKAHMEEKALLDRNKVSLQAGQNRPWENRLKYNKNNL